MHMFFGRGECVPAGDISEVCPHPRLDPNPTGKGKEVSQGGECKTRFLGGVPPCWADMRTDLAPAMRRPAVGTDTIRFRRD
jgi:hypothetical protein